MGGQGVERREILRYIGIAAVASSFPGFSKWAFACPQDHPKVSSQVGAASYKPLFFSPQQYQMVEHLAEMIIPEDDSPGAKQAGVAEFIDFMVANRAPVSTSRDIRSTDDAIAAGNEAQNRFRAGLDWIDARSHSEFKRQFLDCTPEQQNSLVEELAYKASIGYPGLRTVWPKMPGCPHPDDPEHAHLREPASSSSLTQPGKN